MYKSTARWILSAPLLVFIILVVLFPLGYGFYTAFHERTLFSEATPFVGLENFATIVGDKAFWSSALFTAQFSIVTVVLEVVLGLGLALLMNRQFYGKRTLLTLVLLPIMVASSLMGVLWRIGLNDNMGIVPAVFRVVGIDFQPFSLAGVVPTLFAAETLHWTPLIFLLFYAGLQSFPQELTESATVDGAGYWRIVWSLTLPHLRPIIAVALFIRLIDAVKSFDIIYVLTGGGPGSLTTTTSLYIYQKAFVFGDFGLAAAGSVIMLMGMLVLVPLVVRQAGAKRDDS